MNNKDYASELDKLISEYHKETRHLEFKSNYQEANAIGEYISALSNGATLDNKEYGYLFFGIDDSTLEITGTSFDPSLKKVSFKLDKSNKSPNQYLEMLTGFDDQWYRDLIIKALREHGKLRRADFNKLLLPKLPAILSPSQKKNRIDRLLRELRVKGKISAGKDRRWSLS